MGSLLHARQGSLAARAVGVDVAVASATEALPLQVQGDDEAWVRTRHSACDLSIDVYDFGFSLDGGVKHAFPYVCGVSTI